MKFYNSRKGTPKWERILNIICALILIIVCLWVAYSFIEVWGKNLTTNPEYSKFNLFWIFSEK